MRKSAAQYCWNAQRLCKHVQEHQHDFNNVVISERTAQRRLNAWGVKPLKHPGKEEERRIQSTTARALQRLFLKIIGLFITLGVLQLSPDGATFDLAKAASVVTFDETHITEQYHLAGVSGVKVCFSLDKHCTLILGNRMDGEPMPPVLVFSRPYTEAELASLYEHVYVMNSKGDRLEVIALYSEKGSMTQALLPQFLQQWIVAGYVDLLRERHPSDTTPIDAIVFCDGVQTHIDASLLAAKQALLQNHNIRLNLTLGCPNGTAVWQGMDVVWFRNFKRNSLRMAVRSFFLVEVAVAQARLAHDPTIPRSQRHSIKSRSFDFKDIHKPLGDAIRETISGDAMESSLRAQGLGSVENIMAAFQTWTTSEAYLRYQACINWDPSLAVDFAEAEFDWSDGLPAASKLVDLAVVRQQSVIPAFGNLLLGRKVKPGNAWEQMSLVLEISDLTADNQSAIAMLVREQHFNLPCHHFAAQVLLSSRSAAEKENRAEAKRQRQNETAQARARNIASNPFLENSFLGRCILPEHLERKDDLFGALYALGVTDAPNAYSRIQLQGELRKLISKPVLPFLEHTGERLAKRLNYTLCPKRLTNPKHCCSERHCFVDLDRDASVNVFDYDAQVPFPAASMLKPPKGAIRRPRAQQAESRAPPSPDSQRGIWPSSTSAAWSSEGSTVLVNAEYDTYGSTHVQDVQVEPMPGFDHDPLASGINVQQQPFRADTPLQVPQFGLINLSSVQVPPHRALFLTTASTVVAPAPEPIAKRSRPFSRR